jgi:hypothetical protein
METMTICQSCEARNADTSVFCIRCGESLDTSSARDLGGDTDSLAAAEANTPTVLVDTAAAQLADGQAEAAIHNCRRAVALDPGQVEAHAVLGMAYEQHGELAAALEAYEVVVALAPERNVERQKASLLRLRIEGHRAEEPPARRNLLALIGDKLRANLPVTVGVAAALVVLLIVAPFLVHARRTEANLAAQAECQRQMQLGEQALDLGHAQLEVRGAGRRPFFRGTCRARIAARKACA